MKGRIILMIKEVYEKDLITYEYPPDGGRIPIIDPYDGCTIKCPYCFQMDDKNWNKDLFVKLNISELIADKLKDWNKNDTIFIGSRCDPYLSLENKYELTRKCLIELNRLKIPVMITTKAHYKIILRDIDIFKNYKSDLTVLLGLSNLNQFENSDKDEADGNIKLANFLNEQGIKVWVYITPILPGITDVEKMISKLNEDIPVYLDKLRIEKDSIQMDKMLGYIRENYPDLINIYEEIIINDKSEYIDELRRKYRDNSRIKFIFD